MLLAQAAPPAARPRRRLPVDAYIRDRAGEVARAGNGLDATRTDALLSQLETGKINCVHLPRCDRLPPGVCAGITQAQAQSSPPRGPTAARAAPHAFACAQRQGFRLVPMSARRLTRRRRV